MKPDLECNGSNQISSTSKRINKIANASSVICSAVGSGLFTLILFGPKDIMDYEQVQMASDCAHVSLIAAVILGFLALFLSMLRRFSKGTDIDASEEDSNKRKLLGDNCHGKSRLQDNEALDNCSDKSKQLVLAKHSAAFDNLKTFKPPVPVPEQLDVPKKTVNANTSMSNSTLSHAQREQSQVFENKLVPVKKHSFDLTNQPCNNEFYTKTLNYWNCNSGRKHNSVTDFVETKKIRYFSGGPIERQEEIQVRQTTTYFRYTEAGLQAFKASEVDFNDCSKTLPRFGGFQNSSNLKKNRVSDVISKFESMNFL